MTDTTWKFEWPPDRPNPFRTLGLATDASNEDIVERGKDLCESGTREESLLYRWAMEQLITHPLTRFAYEWMETPGAEYEDDDWERFTRAHRKPPIDPAALSRHSPPELQDFRLDRLLSMFLDEELRAEPAPIALVIEDCPFPPDFGPCPLEVRDVVFG